jgi:diphthamide synthase (EF-2-diphthine--ammonia ligase)
MTYHTRSINRHNLSGENGEYHTVVSDGPIFRKPVLFRTGKTQAIKGYAFVELVPIGKAGITQRKKVHVSIPATASRP